MEEQIAALNLTVNPAKKARIIMIIYDFHRQIDKPVNQDTVAEYVKLLS